MPLDTRSVKVFADIALYISLLIARLVVAAAMEAKLMK